MFSPAFSIAGNSSVMGLSLATSAFIFLSAVSCVLRIAVVLVLSCPSKFWFLNERL